MIIQNYRNKHIADKESIVYNDILLNEVIMIAIYKFKICEYNIIYKCWFKKYDNKILYRGDDLIVNKILRINCPHLNRTIKQNSNYLKNINNINQIILNFKIFYYFNNKSQYYNLIPLKKEIFPVFIDVFMDIKLYKKLIIKYLKYYKK